MRRAVGRLLVAGTPVQDLFLCAKHLFGGAIRHPGAPDRSVSPRPLQSIASFAALLPLSFARLLTANTTKQRLSQNPVSAIFSSPATATTPRMKITATATIRLLNREAAPAPGEPTRPVHRGLYIRAPRLAGCKSNQVPDMIQHTLVHLSLPILFLKTARIFWACFLCSDRLVHHNLSCHNHRVRRPTDLGGSFDGILQPSLESYARAVRARGPLCRA